MAVCATVALLAWGLGELPVVQSLEAKAIDFVQQLEYRLTRPGQMDDVVIVAIDDRSVDPESSLFSDIWGKGGWVNRENWVFHLQFQKDFFKPKVLAFDILFPESKPKPLTERAEQLARAFELRSASLNRQKLYEVESRGNDSVAQILWDMADEREAGGRAPEVVLPIYYPEDARTQERLKRNWDRDMMAAFSLPDEILISPSSVPGYPSALLPVRQFQDAPVLLAAINTPRDRGGLVRRVPMVFRLVDEGGMSLTMPSFSLISFLTFLDIDLQNLKPLGQGIPGMRIDPGNELVLETEERTFRIPLDSRGNLVLRNRVKYQDVNKLSFGQLTEWGLLLDESSDGDLRERSGIYKTIREQITGKVAFIAQSFTGGTDIGNFPLEDYIPNVMAHAIAFQNLMDSEGIVVPSTGQRAAVCFLVGMIFWGMWERVGARGKRIFQLPFLLLIVLIPVTSLLFFVLNSFVVEFLVPASMAIFLTLVQTAHGYALEVKRRNELRKVFAAAVSPDVLKMMEENRGVISLEGARMEATILFSDVAGFTGISERLEPQELSRLLNRYLTPMSNIILSNDGFVDKYEGDAIMAEWGVPVEDKEHARKACRSALLQLKALDELNHEIEKESGLRLVVRMGINSGYVSAGNMGSEERFQYTVMGDAVNLAARLEPANKEYGSHVILGQNTHALLPEAEFTTRLLDKIVVKGKTEPIDIFELIYPVSLKGPWIQEYEEALRAMWARDWERAESGFRASLQSYPDDPAANMMLERVEFFRQHPPDEGWQGETIRTSKD